ncbi:hypothetical protein [Dysosmobacter sp. Sow4_B12]|uniref:hypothetical protein n=1 Tax=Dysosmobacter sp. Sow4_B12 TaxID=3438777 RepID=UPI003F931554
MILYFSGTGNSQYIAERIAVALCDELLSMNDRIKAGDTSPVTSDERLIIGFDIPDGCSPEYAVRRTNKGKPGRPRKNRLVVKDS